MLCCPLQRRVAHNTSLTPGSRGRSIDPDSPRGRVSVTSSEHLGRAPADAGPLEKASWHTSLLGNLVPQSPVLSGGQLASCSPAGRWDACRSVL